MVRWLGWLAGLVGGEEGLGWGGATHHGAGDGAEAAEDDGGQGAVHGVAHDHGEEGARGADEGADDLW